MKKSLLSLACCLFLISVAYSQGGWQKIYPMINGLPYGDGIEAVRQTADGGYILAGVTAHNSGAHENRVVKVNGLGDVQWSNTYTTVSSYSWATNIELAPIGGYFVEGRRTNQVTYKDEVYLQHLDDLGNELWVNFYPQATISTKGAVTADGGYIAVGYDYANGAGPDSVALIKITSNGATDFVKKFAAVNVGIVHSVIQTLSGGYVVESYNNGKACLNKYDANGAFLWQQLYGVQTSHPEYIGKVIENADSTLVVAGNDAINIGANQAYLFKTDAVGNLLWQQHFNQSISLATDVSKTTDGGYIIVGIKDFNSSPKVIIIKTDAQGNLVWSKNYFGDGTGSWKAYSIRQTADGGYIVGGAKVSNFYTRKNMYLIKTDELGEIYSNTLQGYVFDDANSNCDLDSNEYTMANRVIEVLGNQTFYTSTNSDGYYWVRVDTGNYQMILHPSANTAYWQISACSNDTVAVNIPNQYTTIDTNFTHNAIAYCPLLNVELSTPFLRRCFDSNYYVHYCNTGTAAANNVYIDVNFDSFLTLDTANISTSWAMLSPNVYRFNVGNIAIGACAAIPLTVMVSCNAVIGQTHCSEAQIFPTSNCLLPTWNAAVIAVNAVCVNDSITFTINNSGATTSSMLNYTVIQDTTQVSSNVFTIAAGQSTQIIIPVPNGATYTLIAQQEIGYPGVLGDSLVSVSIEGCGGNINTGVVTQFNSYDGSPFLDIDCRMNIGAYDPNDKQGFPAGYSTNHLITPSTVLDYQIRFQNTGTDTAFSILVRDTIPQSLNITSMLPGSSSHPYTYFVHGENAQVVDFIFTNIQLPDSNINEPASHGFVKFKINQKANNTIGTVIENKAGIYFDFNEAIITNTTHHQIGENFVEANLVGLSTKPATNQMQILVYPNPTQSDLTIEIKGQMQGIYQIELINSIGKLIVTKSFSNNKITIEKENLSAGIYCYKITNGDGMIGVGKLVVK